MQESYLKTGGSKITRSLG